MIIETKDGWEGSRKEEYTNDSTCFRKAFKEEGLKYELLNNKLKIIG